MAEILEYDGITGHDLPVSRILEKALEANLSSVIVLGYTPEGDFYFAGSRASGADTVWDLELAKKKLLDVTDN